VELAVFLRFTKSLLFLAPFFCTALLSDGVFAQRPTPTPPPTNKPVAGESSPGNSFSTTDINIDVRGADGAPIEGMAVVTLVSPKGQVAGQGTTLGGNIQFRGLAPSQYTIQVVALGYENAIKELDNNSSAARVIIEMQPASSGEKTAIGLPRIILAPKAQKELGKALEALRARKPTEARSHLEAAYRQSPNHPAVNYLFGVYFYQMNDREKAKSYWTKTLEFDPKHAPALLSLGEALIREKKLPDAESYVKRALESDPSSWRAHAILADVFLKERSTDEAIKEAERALELGHGQAARVQLLLTRALIESGNKERAEKVLQDYVQEQPGDAEARKLLETLRSPAVLLLSPSTEVAIAEAKPSAATEAAIALPLPSNWLPPDVDEKVPPVEPGAVCSLDEVVQKAGKHVEEFIKNVDRFTASEFLKHESFNKWGFAESPETRRFNYVVAIEPYRPGYFNVVEYRGNGITPADFPGGVVTNGLPTLALIFHPTNAGNFDMSCEGLGRWNGGLAWQLHFRQNPNKPNTIREYKLGEIGPAYPVALRGRAWIAADSYQIVRMETDLVAPLPEIRLFADHTLVEYGPVRFRNRNVEMWLPQTAEVYFDWRGRRMHRRHSFSNYLLFSVDEKQRISEPKPEN
jgi:tetratricopeptide (TPR) repeat protein